jgi:hypothetical protein
VLHVTLPVNVLSCYRPVHVRIVGLVSRLGVDYCMKSPLGVNIYRGEPG